MIREEIMPLNHNFHSVPTTDENYVAYQSYYDLQAKASVHDDLIHYMNDSLLWIPCVHLSGGYFKRKNGLSLYGATLINKDSAVAYNHVISSWLRLFSEAPETFEINVGVIINPDKTVGDFRKFKVTRNDLLQELKILHEMGQDLLAGNCLILHLGI
jgi:hypothetical protein